MGRQLIENLWPFFAFARLLGMFPYKRILTEDGVMELKPMAISWKFYWGLNACRWTLIASAITFVNIWIFSKTTRTFDQWNQCLVDYSGGQSVTNGFALLILFLAVNLESIFLQRGNFKMREKTCELSSQFKNFDSLYVDNPVWTVFGLFMATLFTTTLYAWQIGSTYQNCLDLSLINILPLPIIFGLVYFIGSIPLLVFLSITFDHFNGLSNEIKNLTVIIGQHKLNRNALNYVSNMIIRLEKIRSSLSYNLFCAMSCLLVEILVLSYQMSVLFFEYLKTKDWVLLLGAAINLLSAIRLLTSIWLINDRAQRVTNQVHQLKDYLQDTFISRKTNITVRFEGQNVPVAFMRDRIVGKLGNFTGFDGEGYFVFGKSFMTAFLALLVSYLFTLLHFRVSESH